MESHHVSRFETSRRPAQYTPVNLGVMNRISEQDTESFKFLDTPIDTLEIVCRIEDLVESSLKYDATLADSTGRFKGIIYKNKDRNPTALRDYKYIMYGYARCIGQLRKFQNSANFVISYMKNLHTYEEVMAHRTKFIWNYIKFIRGPLMVKQDIDTMKRVAVRQQLTDSQRSSTGITLSTDIHIKNNSLPNSILNSIEQSDLTHVVIDTLRSSTNPLVFSTGITEREMYCMLNNKFDLDSIKLVFNDLVRSRMLFFTQERTYVYNK